MDSRQRERLARIEKAAATRDPDRAKRHALRIVSTLHLMRLSVPHSDPKQQEALKASAERARLACESDDPSILDEEDRRQFQDTYEAIRQNSGK